jgi:sortase B
MKLYNIGDNKSKKTRSYDLNATSQQKEDEEKKKRKRKRGIKAGIITSAILIPCLIFGIVMYRGYILTEKAYDEVEREYANLAMSYVTEDDSDDSSVDSNMTKKIDFTALSEKEADIYAWITIPDTNIDYPMLQSGSDKNNDDYWLNHNLDGSSGYPGTIFTETMFGKDFKTFNTVIYGHNMKNQTMFGSLHNYSSSDYLNEHPYVYIYTSQMTYKYEIICASTVSDAHLAISYNGYKTESQRQQFLNYLLSHASTVRDVDTDIYDNYITLSTCNNNDTQRYVILAKCIEKTSTNDYD